MLYGQSSRGDCYGKTKNLTKTPVRNAWNSHHTGCLLGSHELSRNGLLAMVGLAPLAMGGALG